MQEYREPLFTKGRVLKKESLECLRDFPGRLSRLALSDWQDGILYGFHISYGEGQLTVESGAAWYEGRVVLAGREVFPFTDYGKPVTVRLRLYPETSAEDFYVRPLEIRLEGGEPGAGELELGRFRLSEGARLRREYRDLKDFRTAYNTLDITRVPFSGPGGVTVSPVLLRAFAGEIMENGAAGELDAAFALQCLNHPPVERGCLLWYLSRRLNEPYRELNHSEIYERLVRIAGRGGRGMGRSRIQDGPAVI